MLICSPGVIFLPSYRCTMLIAVCAHPNHFLPVPPLQPAQQGPPRLHHKRKDSTLL